MACSTSKLDILLADGKTKLVSDLKVGDEVDTLHQHTFQRGKHKVVFVETKRSKLLSLTFLGETFECSPTHRFYSKDKGEWIEAKDLVEGDKVISLDGEIEFISAKEIEDGDVVDLTVEGAHTYISGNILSHNKGDYYAPPPPPPDTTFKDYLKYQTERTEDEGYKDWTNQLQTYKSKKSKQASGRAGWDDYKKGVQTKLGKGLIDYGQAETQLKDYARDYNLAADTVAWSGGVDPRKSWERNKGRTDITYTDSPTYQTPDRWKDWSVNKALGDLSDYYTGGEGGTGGLLGQRRDTNIKAGYEEILGRQATDAEVATAKERLSSGYYKDIDSFKTGLTSGSEYKKKFSNSYLENYYDSMYGAQHRDAAGDKTGKRTFNFDKSLLPSYKGDLEGDTGVKLPEWKDSYTGTPAEIDFSLDNIRESRKFLYSAGLTNLQGNIDKETQKLKNEGGKEIARIGKEGDIYKSVVDAFNF
jgi:hypothetical protein